MIIKKLIRFKPAFVYLGIVFYLQVGIPRLMAQSVYSVAYFKNLTIEQGLTNNEVKSILQDEEGFMWLGTGSGVDRFDGYRIDPFRPALQKSYPVDQLLWRPLKIIWDKAGRFYLGSDFGGLQVYDPVLRTMFHYTEAGSGLSSDAVLSLFCDSRGIVWIGTTNGLDHFDPHTRTIRSIDVPKGEVLAITEDLSGDLWIAVARHGLFRFRTADKSIISFPSSHPLYMFSGANTINDLYFNEKDAQLLIAAEDGLWNWNLHKAELSRLPVGLDQKLHSFSSVQMDQNGNIWAGTRDQGLLFYRTKEKKAQLFQHDITNPQSIISNKVACLYVDQHNNIWVGTYGEGVSVISADFSKFDCYLREKGMNDVKSLARAKDGSIWMSFVDDLACIPPQGGAPVYFDLSLKNACGEEIEQIALDDEGRLILGTGCGIRSWSPKFPTVFTPVLPDHSPIPQTSLLSLYYFDNRLYVGTTLSDHQKGLWVYDFRDQSVGRFVSEADIHSLSGNNVLRMFKSEDGRLWIGTWDELNLLLPDGRFFRTDTLILDKSCLQAGSTTAAIWEDHNGYIWYSRIDGGGLVVLNPKTQDFNCFSVDKGLPNSSVTAILQDEQNNLWLGTYLGVCRISYPADPFSIQQLKVASFTTRDGLLSNTIWNGIASQDRKRLYFGTGSGLIGVYPENLVVDTTPPVLQFTDFKLFNESVLPNDPTEILDVEIRQTRLLKLNYRQNVFSIEFAGLNFYENERYIYSYRMKGVDNHWIEAGNQHVITFANLPPGDYYFEARVKGQNSRWSTTKELHIHISPPFWQRLWFLSLVALALIMLGYWLNRFLTRQLLKVQTIRNRIAADLHDDIGTTLSHIELMGILGSEEAQGTESGRLFFQRIRNEAKRSNESLHFIVWSINPENDHLEKVVTYLTRTALEILESAGLEVQFQTGSPPAHVKISSEKRKDLLLAFKESLINICKYAEATKVSISLDYSPGRLNIQVKDNGKGLPDNAWDKGSGLQNIQNRMKKWQGNAAFITQEDKGLEVHLDLPIP